MYKQYTIGDILTYKAAAKLKVYLTSVIASKSQWKRFNRRVSSWAKGVLAETLGYVCVQRKAKHGLVNGGNTSQIDSTNGLLKGKRESDKFYRANGAVLQAAHNVALNAALNAALNVLARSLAQLSVNSLELGRISRQPIADKSYVQLCTSF